MIVKTVRISEKGQLAVPVEIRQKAGIQRGDELIIFYQNGRILLEPAELLSNRLNDDLEDIKMFTQRMLERVWDNEEDEAWNDSAKRYH